MYTVRHLCITHYNYGLSVPESTSWRWPALMSTARRVEKKRGFIIERFCAALFIVLDVEHRIPVTVMLYYYESDIYCMRCFIQSLLSLLGWKWVVQPKYSHSTLCDGGAQPNRRRHSNQYRFGRRNAIVPLLPLKEAGVGLQPPRHLPMRPSDHGRRGRWYCKWVWARANQIRRNLPPCREGFPKRKLLRLLRALSSRPDQPIARARPVLDAFVNFTLGEDQTLCSRKVWRRLVSEEGVLGGLGQLGG